MGTELFALLLFLECCYGYGTGAGPDACLTLMPGHGAAKQSSPSPYNITVSSYQYSAGATLKVTLKGSKTFKGFLLRATNKLDGNFDDVAIGRIAGDRQQDADAVKSMCANSAALTHNGNSAKSEIVAKWTAPNPVQGNIIFYATFLEDYSTYWVMQASAPIWDGVSAKPVIEQTTVAASGVSVTYDRSDCGKTRGCWDDCTMSGGVCSSQSFQVKWNRTGALFEFEIAAKIASLEYAAIGFAPTTDMKDVSIVACTQDGVQMYYAPGETVQRQTNGPITAVRYKHESTMVTCTFTYDNNKAKELPMLWKDLESGQYYAFLAKGRFIAGGIQKHVFTPTVTANKLDFKQISIEGAGTSSKTSLYKAHGALMIIAWVLCTSIGVILPRYYKLQWPTTKICDQKIWFQVHRIIMFVASAVSLIAFILILIAKGGLITFDGLSLPEKAHHPIGLLVIVCSLLNPFIAIFRCDPKDKKRWIFNWFHWFFGTVAQFFGIVAIFLGMLFQNTAELPPWLVFVMMVFCIVHACTEFLLEGHKFHISRQRNSGEATELSSVGSPGTAAGNLEERKRKEQAFRTAVFVSHVVCVTILSLIMIFVISFWKNEAS